MKLALNSEMLKVIILFINVGNVCNLLNSRLNRSFITRVKLDLNQLYDLRLARGNIKRYGGRL